MAHDRLTYGVTAEQIDNLNNSIRTITALGDIIAISDDRPLDDHSMSALGEMVYIAACGIRDILNQVNEQLFEPADGKAVPPIKERDLPTFASDMLDSLLRAHTIMLEMRNSDHRSDGTKDVGDSCRIVSKLVWRVSKYVMENFETSAGPDDEP